MKRFALVFLPAWLLLACSQEKAVDVNQELSGKLAGDWINVAFKIEMITFRNSDSSRILEVTEDKWKEKMRINPVKTSFNTNGTYIAEHRNLRDSLVIRPAGKWMIVGDSLHMMDTFPQVGVVYKYKLKLEGKTATLTGHEDCDRDGKQDDIYNGYYRRP